MKKSIIIISSFLMVALVAGSVFAWGHGRGQGMGMGFSSQACPNYGGQANFNDLSREKRDELNGLRQNFIDETYELRSAMLQKHQEVRMLMETSDPDRAQLNKISGDITELQAQMRSKQIDFQLDAKKIAPELGIMMFGQGHGKWSKRGGQRGFQGHSGHYNN